MHALSFQLDNEHYENKTPSLFLPDFGNKEHVAGL